MVDAYPVHMQQACGLCAELMCRSAGANVVQYDASVPGAGFDGGQERANDGGGGYGNYSNAQTQPAFGYASMPLPQQQPVHAFGGYQQQDAGGGVGGNLMDAVTAPQVSMHWVANLPTAAEAIGMTVCAGSSAGSVKQRLESALHRWVWVFLCSCSIWSLSEVHHRCHACSRGTALFPQLGNGHDTVERANVTQCLCPSAAR